MYFPVLLYGHMMIIDVDTHRRQCRNCLRYLCLSPVNVVRSELLTVFCVFSLWCLNRKG